MFDKPTQFSFVPLLQSNQQVITNVQLFSKDFLGEAVLLPNSFNFLGLQQVVTLGVPFFIFGCLYSAFGI